MKHLLWQPFKKWRSMVLTAIYPSTKMVCFTSGNAGKMLRKYNADVLCIGEHEELKPSRWFTPLEIRQMFPDRLDVTSGHLSIADMTTIGLTYRALIGDLDANEIYDIPTGSGETLVSLKLAYPEIRFRAAYNIDEHTAYSEEAPLNDLVELLAYEIIKEGKEYVFGN